MDTTAVMGKRIGAYIIDAIIGVIITVVVFFSLADSFDTPFDPCGQDESPALCFYTDGTVIFAEDGDAAAVFAASFGTWFIMHAVISSLAGGSPGKLMVGLRVVDQETGQRASWGKNIGRTLLWIVDGQPLGLPLVGLISGVASKGHRRVGDMVAKTLVVDKASLGQPPVVPGLTAPPTGGYTAQPAGYTPPPPGAYTPPPPGGSTPPPPGSGAAPPPGTPPAPMGDAISPPDAFAPPVAPPPTPAAEPDGVSAPKWDVDRNAYIQWDPELSEWMEYDEAAKQWVPISR